MYQEDIYDITALEFATQFYADGETKPVELSEEELRHLLELINKDWDEMTEQDTLDEGLLWEKLNVYISQNNLWEEDYIRVIYELLGEEPTAPGGDIGYD